MKILTNKEKYRFKMMKTLRQIIWGMLLLAAGAGVCHAQQLNMADRLPLDTTVRIGCLDNGMAYYLRHNAKSPGLADFYIVYDVGSVQEEDSQTGLAHFLEHMMFNGTHNFPGDSMIRWLESIGMQFGSNLNAATGMEMTFYQLTQVPLKRETIADSVLLILHDWSGYLALEDREIDKERGVIIEELRQRSDAAFRVGRKAAPYVYGDTRYAHRDMLGSEQFLRIFKSDTLRSFYSHWYRPDLQAIVIVGDFDVDLMEAKLKKVMADIPKPQRPIVKEECRIPDNTDPVVAVITDPELQLCKANFYIKRPGIPKELNMQVGANCMNLMMNVATVMMNARFEELIQQSGCPFASARLLNAPLTNMCDVLELQVLARGEAIAEAFTSAYGELERMRRFGFTQEEFDLARTNFLRGGKYAYDTRYEQDNNTFVWQCINHYVKNVPLLSAEHQWAFMQLMLMKQITLDKINELIRILIVPANNVLVITAPDKVKTALPKAEELTDFFSWVQAVEMEPYQAETIDKTLLSEEVKPGRIKKSEKGKYGSTVWTLNNGIRVVVLPTTDKPLQVMMNGQADGGLSTIPDTDYYTALMVAQLVNMSGVGGFTSEQLRKVIGSKSTTVQVAVDRFLTGINGNAAKEDIETMLQLTYLYFTQPNFDRERFELLMEAKRMNLANSAGIPDFIAAKEINETTYGNQLRTRMLDEQILAGIDFGKMESLYRRFFTDAAGNYTFYFLGDIDLNVIKPLIEKYIGGIPAGNQRLAWKDDSVRVLPGVKEKQVEVRSEISRSMVNLSYTGEMEYTQENTVIMGMLSTCLQSCYNQLIREEKGGSYGVSVNGTLTRQPVGSYNLNISFQTNPGMVDELVKTVREELRRLSAEGPERAELDKHLAYWRKVYAENRQSTQTRLLLLQTYYTWGEDWEMDYEKLLKKATPDKICRLARKILADGNLIQVVVSQNKF